MLIRVLRQAMRTIRSAGWRGLAIASLYVVALAIVLPQPSVLLFVGMVAQNIVTFALVRQLAAHRGITAKLDGPPRLTRTGAPATLGLGPGPVSDADKDVRTPLRAAGGLARSAMRLSMVQLFEVLAIVTLLLMIGGQRVLPDENPTHQQIVRVLIGVVPISALVTAFLTLAAQRIAIEGDPRVIVAVAHAIKIARSAYGTLFVLSLLEPLLLLAEVAAGDSLPVRIVALVLHPLLRLIVVAACNEVYAEGPSLVVPEARRAEG